MCMSPPSMCLCLYSGASVLAWAFSWCETVQAASFPHKHHLSTTGSPASKHLVQEPSHPFALTPTLSALRFSDVKTENNVIYHFFHLTISTALQSLWSLKNKTLRHIKGDRGTQNRTFDTSSADENWGDGKYEGICRVGNSTVRRGKVRGGEMKTRYYQKCRTKLTSHHH